MNSATKWIVSFVHPRNGNFWAGLLTVGIIAGLSHWHEAWLNPRVEDWLSHQNGLTKFAGYLACGIGVYMVALIVIASVAGPIHYAIDPAYATERAQKRRVKRLKIGDRIRVTDVKTLNAVARSLARALPARASTSLGMMTATQTLFGILM
jgi:hypothetical protein